MAQQRLSFREFSAQLEDACKTDNVASVIDLVSKASHPDSNFTIQDILVTGSQYAPERNAMKVLAYLVQQGADVRTLHGPCLVHHGWPSRELLEFLLAHGWDINSGADRSTPLLWHILRDHELVEWFLDHGANVHLPGAYSYMRSPILQVAARHGNIATFELLRSRGADLCPEILPEAVTLGVHASPRVGEASGEDTELQLGLIRHLIDVVGLDVNTNAVFPNYTCATPLCRVACLPKNDPKELIWLLLDRGADLNRGGPPGSPSFITSAAEGAKKWQNTRFIEAVEEWQAKHPAGAGVPSGPST